MLKDEYWYGLCSEEGFKMPISEKSKFEVNLITGKTENQSVPFLVSNKGRYIWSDYGFNLLCENGKITISENKAQLVIKDGYENLKGAFLAAAKEHFPANGVMPPEDFFTKPQFNTWIELTNYQNQKDIMAYAQAAIDNGFPPGIMMLDATWHEYYGGWKFAAAKFPDPKGMVDKLHEMGFKVMLWTCPFVSPDSLAFDELNNMHCLVYEPNGDAAIRKWWCGYSAVLDLTNPDAVNWYNAQNKLLMDEYGIDGFKFDAGDVKYYHDTDVTFKKVEPSTQCELWAENGLLYPYNEYRACFKQAGKPLVQRLCDKAHSWDNSGVAGLVPNSLSQGIMGYSFICPDMIGGGQAGCFGEGSKLLDQELFVRYAQCTAMLPMMQFSAAPWRILTKENLKLCLDATKTHDKFSDLIIKLAKHAAKTGEPIVRYMEYEFPNEGMETATDQFMLGDSVLVAPVFMKGQTKRTVKLPKGKWNYVLGGQYDGGEVTVDAPIEILPYFTRVIK